MAELLEPPPKTAPVPGMPEQGSSGASTGLNIVPGSDDDGWIVPQPVTLADGTQIQLYKDGEALHAAYEAIKQAQHRICLEMYIFASDDTGRAFADLLCEKAKAGVLVYVIYDSFGSIGTDGNMFEQLKRAGVRVLEFHPFWPWEGKFSWRPVNRDHRKLLIIDNDVAALGGMNIAREYAGSWVVQSSAPEHDFWRDTAISVRGPGMRQFLTAFAKTWQYVTHRGKMRAAEYVYNLDGVCGPCEWPIIQRRKRGRVVHGDLPEGKPQFGILASAPTRQSPLRPFLNKLFREARKSICLTMAYFAPHDDLIDELCAAARRGVKVRLMVPAKGDVKLLVIAAQSFYDTLLTAGVQIYERQGVVLHAKTMVIDGLISMVGSTNLDYRSIEYNLELSALIRSREFGRQMEELFEHDVRFSRRIRADKWRYRPNWDRFVQWAVSRTRYWL